ncbi:MAG: SDR family oxidoreductase [Bacteroidales bacterium]
MKVLLTGITGYIGGRLLPILVDEGYQIVCSLRDKLRFPEEFNSYPGIEIIECDFLKNTGMTSIPPDIDVAFYLVHSMSASTTHFQTDELVSAQNFREAIERTSCKQVIYLSGFEHSDHLSKHLSSRKATGDELRKGKYALTVFHAGIVIGSGSASFEIIRDLVEKLPLMGIPPFMKHRCQPIAVRDILYYLSAAIMKEDCFDRDFDVGGPDILSYENMLREVARIRHLRRKIIIIPFIKTRLCANWLYFVTSTSYNLALNLSESMKDDAICMESSIKDILPHELLNYEDAVKLAYARMESDNVISGWRDSFSSSNINWKITDHIHVPKHGVYKHIQETPLTIPEELALQHIWRIGGSKGWLYANWLWKARGILDLIGRGVGLSRGRTHQESLSAGEALDFWRVLIADKNKKRLLLYAEMIMPGEGWLEFTIIEKQKGPVLKIEATMRPHGVAGRIYWLSTLAFHHSIFRGMGEEIAQKNDVLRK